MNSDIIYSEYSRLNIEITRYVKYRYCNDFYSRSFLSYMNMKVHKDEMELCKVEEEDTLPTIKNRRYMMSALLLYMLILNSILMTIVLIDPLCFRI